MFFRCLPQPYIRTVPLNVIVTWRILSKSISFQCHKVNNHRWKFGWAAHGLRTKIVGIHVVYNQRCEMCAYIATLAYFNTCVCDYFFSVLTRIKRGNFSSGELWNHKRKLVVHSLSVYMYLSEGGDKKKKIMLSGAYFSFNEKNGSFASVCLTLNL